MDGIIFQHNAQGVVAAFSFSNNRIIGFTIIKPEYLQQLVNEKTTVKQVIERAQAELDKGNLVPTDFFDAQCPPNRELIH